MDFSTNSFMGKRYCRRNYIHCRTMSWDGVVLVVVDSDIPPSVLEGLVVAIIVPFLVLYLFAKVWASIRTRQHKTVGPHVIVPVRRNYNGTPHDCYRCKYCEKEFEREEFFHSEDCEEFSADGMQ